MAAESPLPLSLEEHRELGAELKRSAARLRELKKLIAAVYGPNSVAAFNIAKAIESMEDLQQGLEVQAVQDCPGLLVNGLYR